MVFGCAVVGDFQHCEARSNCDIGHWFRSSVTFLGCSCAALRFTLCCWQLNIRHSYLTLLY
jgi:hypothetical protein